MYDTLGEILYRTIVHKILNIQRCQNGKSLEKKVIRFYSILIFSCISGLNAARIIRWYRGAQEFGAFIGAQHAYTDIDLLGDPELTANLYCNSCTSVLWRLRDYLRLLMVRTLYGNHATCSVQMYVITVQICG